MVARASYAAESSCFQRIGDIYDLFALEREPNDEWQSLYCHFQGFPLAEEPPSIQQAMIWIARLGGFLARNHDGLPGVKTLWRGLQRLNDIASTWKLLHSSQNQDS